MTRADHTGNSYVFEQLNRTLFAQMPNKVNLSYRIVSYPIALYLSNTPLTLFCSCRLQDWTSG